MSLRSKLLTGDLVGSEFIFETIPNKLEGIGSDWFTDSPIRLSSVSTNIKTGGADYHTFGKTGDVARGARYLMNNADWAHLTSPSISTVVEPVHEEGVLACQMLLDMELNTAYVAIATCPGLSKKDLEGSLYAHLAERSGILPASAEEYIDAVALDAAEARLLGQRAGMPAFRTLRTTVDASGRPFEVAVIVSRSDRTRLHDENKVEHVEAFLDIVRRDGGAEG